MSWSDPAPLPDWRTRLVGLPDTTRLYDRSGDRITVGEIERIRI